MSQDVLNEREFELINVIGAEMGSNQRSLSRCLSLSLGTTNILIRRLISKGYIRIRQLNKRKVEYILTPKGFAEKYNKSIKYTLKTINSIELIKGRLKEILQSLYDKNIKKFYIHGESGLVSLVEIAFKETKRADCNILRLKDLPEELEEGVVLICRENVLAEQLHNIKYIDLLKELSEDHQMLTNAYKV